MTASSLGGLHLRCLAALVLFLCGTPFGGPSSAHADVTVATVSNPTPVSFFAGRLSWSAFDSARNGYVLMTHAAGSTSVVPARERSVPFDADLGPDEHGDTVAVYSRCGREPVGTVWRAVVAATSSSSVSGQVARRVSPVRTARAARSSFPPFGTRGSVRARLRAAKGKGRGPGVPVRPLAARLGALDPLTIGPQAMRHSPAGRQGDLRCGSRGRSDRARPARAAARLRLELARGFCPGAITSAWLDTIGSGRREIQSACSELQGRAVLSPTISGGHVHYVRALLTGGDQGTAGAFWRYRISSGQRTEVSVLKGRVVMWSATDAGRTFYLLSGGYMSGCAADPLLPGTGGPCSINELAP